MRTATLALLFGLFTAAFGQTISGVIVGTVADPSGLAVGNAKVVLMQTTTGVYSVAVEATGFKKVERTQINLSANERLALGTIALEVGALAETVTVSEQSALLQT